MNKKKEQKMMEKRRKMEEMSKIERKGKCLKCSKPMVKNHEECHRCRKRRKLRSKANSRGHNKKYYESE